MVKAHITVCKIESVCLVNSLFTKEICIVVYMGKTVSKQGFYKVVFALSLLMNISPSQNATPWLVSVIATRMHQV